MSELKLQKVGENWVVEFMGKLRHVNFNIDESITWRTLGIHEKGAVCFSCDLGGNIESIKLVTTGEELTELVIPKGHQLGMNINITKAFIGEKNAA